VLDAERRLLGVLNLRELLRAPREAPMESLMTADVVKVSPTTRVRDVARLLLKYGFRALPVVDERNVFLGAVRFRSVVVDLLPLWRE
jgi:magnesium transporter